MRVRFVLFLLHPIYNLLYHQFAWTYDLAAAIVSLGHWQDWVQAVLPFLEGSVLELGFGPGHLQLSLGKKEFQAFGLDQSRQMALQASRRLKKQTINSQLVSGYAQNIPFLNGVFNSVVATFPSEYIFDLRTLEEVYRVLASGGKLIILPMAWITGQRPLERLAAWLFRLSSEATGKPRPVSDAIRNQFTHLGFKVSSEIVEMRGSQVLIVVAEK
jgi:ubiquinone/menaquinone biosynthesis C-methylase UbiE